MARRDSVKDPAALEHANWIGYLTGVARCSSGSDVVRTGGVLSILTGMPFDWFNQVLVEEDSATPDDLLAGVALARARLGPFVVRLRGGVDDRFIPLLRDAGLRSPGEATITPGMVAHPIDRELLARQAAPEFEIRRITDAAGLDVHRSVVTAGFASHPSVAAGTTCRELLDLPGCVLYVGCLDGVPVASGMGWRTGSTIGVYAISTVASARRQGFGASMTAHVVLDGLAAGCDAAALQASAMGRPIYERLGFRTVVRYESYA